MLAVSRQPWRFKKVLYKLLNYVYIISVLGCMFANASGFCWILEFLIFLQDVA